MKKFIKQIQTGCVATLATLLIMGPAIAEDIEIYQSGNLGTATVNPNIMFILDTSGSMSRELEIDETYDPAIDYSTRAGACFETDRMYPSITSDVACTAAFKTNFYKLSQNQCQRSKDAFAVTGFYNSTYAQWNPTKSFWGLLKDSVSDAKYIECSPDQGIHGDGGAGTYIDVNGSGDPYTSSPTDEELSWGSIESQTITMYTGNWMNYKVTSSQVTSTYIDVMRDVIKNMIFSIDDVNIGLMRFDHDRYPEGGPVRYQVQDVSLNRVNMKSEMDTWAADGYTPLSETLYESFLYFSGGEVDYGKTSTPKSVGGSFIDGEPKNYQSPIDPDFADCQKQFVILLSDGLPTEDTSAESKIEALPGFVATNGSTSDCSGSGSGSCLDDLAGYMNRPEGYSAYLGSGNSVNGVRTNTYTIGFGQEIPILQAAAREGGGEYYVAYSATDLLTSLTAIISSIKDIYTTFSSPAVSVNAFNRTTNRSDLYFTLFKPDTVPHWDGNFKRFKLAFDSQGVPSIVDQRGDPAVDPTSGFFKTDALSFWTTVEDAPEGDGGNTSRGGAASKLFNGTPTAAGRKVYTDITGSGELSDAANRVWEGSTAIKEEMGWDGNTADTAQTDYYNNLAAWVRGIDVKDNYGGGSGGLSGGDGDTTDARPVMGDPLHAQPALVQYGGTDDDPDITAYVATNDGLLHAFTTTNSNVTGGVEQFAFLPPELLPDMSTLFQNSGSNKFYGLDGTVSTYIIDKNVNGIIEPGNGDKVYLFFGMRRGGNNIYAMDVTNRDAPELMWTIRGGPDALGTGVADTSLGDYSELGETWSKPTVRIIRLDAKDVPILIFGAGYDTDQDSVAVRTDDGIGRGIYIVNALTGQLLWRMGPDGGANLTNSNMRYSIPSDVGAVDTNGDGYVDHIYVGDMGGQLWRVDISNALGETNTNITDIITGGRIGDFADDSVESNRRFYYPPSVAIGKDENDKAFTALVLTSGYRAHPTNTKVQDKIFMVRDTPVNGAPSTYNTLVVNDATQDLYNATANLIGQGNETQQKTARTDLNDADGWFIDLDKSSGEKGLTKALIFAGDVFLTTYEPYDSSNDNEISCEPKQGDGYLYHMNLFDAKPVKNYDTVESNDEDALTVADRRVQLKRSGIPANPSPITTKEGSALCIGTECNKLEGAGLHKTVYWFEE